MYVVYSARVHCTFNKVRNAICMHYDDDDDDGGDYHEDKENV